ncbi:MAG: type II toxin-antitoxin system Phd/YefM family antitoxin [Rubrobacteraceae bacterium]
MMRVTTEEAKDILDALLAEAAKGEEVLVAREDGRVFKILPVARKRGGLGIARGEIRMSEGFDEIPEGFEEYMP